jgi:1,2-phenylacetyl-CoA epoxidase PaaB subunit
MSVIETSDDVIVHEPAAGELWIVRRGKLPAFAASGRAQPRSTSKLLRSKAAKTSVKASKAKLLLRGLRTKAAKKSL